MRNDGAPDDSGNPPTREEVADNQLSLSLIARANELALRLRNRGIESESPFPPPTGDGTNEHN